MAKGEAIQQALGKIDGIYSKSLSKGEIKLLPDILAEDELPQGIITGLYQNRNGILVATNKRAIFIDKGMMSMKVEEFPYDRVTSVEHNTGMVMGGLTIHAAGNAAKIGKVPKAQVRPFADLLRERIATPQSAPPSAPQEDRMVQLERIGNLRTQGILTDEEFETEKKKILGT